MLSAAVIGCGPAGMAMATRLRQKGCMVTCFEIGNDAGGMWNATGFEPFTSRGLLAPLYSSMRCVLPKDLMSYSDQRFDYTAPQFPHHTVVRQYLNKYAEGKGVRAITRFNTKVESCRYDEESSQWKLVTVNIVNGDVLEWSFDRVAVCTGQYHKPRFPAGAQEALKGFSDGGGDIIHSSHLKNFRAYNKKRVVVVGDGVGAYDCARELLRSGASVTHSTMLERPADDMSHFAASLADQAKRRSKAMGGVEGGSSPAAWSWDPIVIATKILSRLPFVRNQQHKANEIVTKWLRYQSEEVLKVPRVGRLLRSADERDLVFAEDPMKKREQDDFIKEAIVRSSAKGQRIDVDAGALPEAEDDDQQPTDAIVKDANQVMLNAIDAVVFATGYELSFPFLHDDIRHVVEGRAPALRIEKGAGGQQDGDSTNNVSDEDELYNRRGLYLGVLFAKVPTLAFIGTQRDLLPPFMMFEAQSCFVANVFSHRTAIPLSENGLAERESQLCDEFPELMSIYSERGVGLHSATYYNTLFREVGPVEPRSTYSSQLAQRKLWVLLNGGLMTWHKMKSLAPLKRKKQHLLFSNKV